MTQEPTAQEQSYIDPRLKEHIGNVLDALARDAQRACGFYGYEEVQFDDYMIRMESMRDELIETVKQWCEDERTSW